MGIARRSSTSLLGAGRNGHRGVLRSCHGRARDRSASTGRARPRRDRCRFVLQGAFPGLRVGWITGPPAVVAHAARRQGCTDLGGSPFLEAAALPAVSRGVFEDQLRRLRTAARAARRSSSGPREAPRVSSRRAEGRVLAAGLAAARVERARVDESRRRAGVCVLPGPAMSVSGADDILRVAYAAVGGERVARRR